MRPKLTLRCLAFAAAMLLGGCATVAPLPTPTGNPEITVNTTDMGRIKGAIISVLAANGYTLGADTNYNMAFSKPMEGSGAALYQVALGNAYSSTPMWNMSFTFAPSGGGTHIYGHVNISMANAFGRVDQTNVDKGKAGHEMQAALVQIKSNVESSPARPSHHRG